ncbi:LuxR C-terminal-related transcriptional regulator [Catenuloplanes atrovinosus]|uniref:ATP/maltotriose-dependent transcriptional regulator MalT n=1 Tax=Catenuloplanes atrovinosus TaxID=137266 RepID=A0AAE3YUQ3_9ACTN|nr:LuxR C-terminal-related transcriptional regulator [Catenuloplanes atrovinosus]MDR7279016.1 ATP/maltotriose-dependent transcriptional regulator MalT [Catenuloplanes atrovinosus]
MRPWSFVGRTQELQRLVAAATSGGERGLIFSGVAGIGKSRLLREGVDVLPRDGYATWYASANIATAGLPFGGLTQVLPPDQPVGLSPAGLLRWAMDSLVERAAGRRIVLAIDDAHLLDPTSAALVYLIVRSGHATVLGTLRSGEPVPLPIRALWTDDLVDHAELSPLTIADTTHMLGEILGGEIESASAERLWRMSLGNALFLRELVIAAQAGDEMTEHFGVWRWTGRLELAPDLTDLIDTRIGRLSPDVRTAVELVALGEPLGLDLLTTIVRPAEVEIAEERGLIRVTTDDRRHNVRLAHPLYGEVVRRRCPVSRSRRLTALLADAVEGVGARRRDDLLRVAVWRLDSGTAKDPALLLGAGLQAYSRFDVPLALRLAKAAVDAGGGFSSAELLATLLMFADQPDDALQVIDSVWDEADTDERRTRWYSARALICFWGLSREKTVTEISEAVGGLRDANHRSRLRAFESMMRFHQLEHEDALNIGRAVLDRPATDGISRALVYSMLTHLRAARGELTDSDRAASRVVADLASWQTEMPYIKVAMELGRGTRLILGGDLRSIDEIVADEFADLADAGEFRLGSGYVSVLRAQAARLRGQTGDALRHSLQACAMLAASRVFAGLAHAERAMAAALRGEAALAAEAMADSDRTHGTNLLVLYPWREQARAWTRAAAGDLAGAVETLRQLAERLRRDRMAGHELYALHDLVRLGFPALPLSLPEGGLTTVTERLAELARQVDGPMPSLISRHARAAAGGSEAELLWVADQFARQDFLLFAAEATATAVRLLRDQRSPQTQLIGARLAELKQRCQLIDTPALRVDRVRLTERERQVAELAAMGTPSKEIAEQLFLSARTVENHLQRVYVKLGISGRTELPAALQSISD